VGIGTMSRDDPASLRALAVKCRQLAGGISSSTTASSLRAMAIDYESLADEAAEEERCTQPLPSAGSRLTG
jgi:hypothetical protein